MWLFQPSTSEAAFQSRSKCRWLYGSGFPKARDLSKDIDRIVGAKRKVVGRQNIVGYTRTKGEHGVQTVNVTECAVLSKTPVSPEAAQWEGWHTALKPAQEPIVVARKPHKKSIAANLLVNGVGGLNVDACRVGSEGGTARSHQGDYGEAGANKSWRSGHDVVQLEIGRFPANVITDGSPEIEECFPTDRDGSAARFFYCAKPSKKEKGGTSHVTVKPVVRPH